MRTKEVADRVGVNTQTLRYYERRGLLPEPPRSPGGYRVYPGIGPRRRDVAPRQPSPHVAQRTSSDTVG